MRSFLKIFLAVFAIGIMFAPSASRALTDEEKKQLFLKAREEMTVETPTPEPKATSTPKPKPAAHHTATPTPAPTPAKTPTPKLITYPEETPQPSTPRPHPQETPRATPAPSTPTPAAKTPPPVAKTPEPSDIKPTVIIEKTDENVPEPAPPPEPHGWWPWSRPTNYKYLTRSVIDAIRNAPVARGRWRYIVVHNSGTRQGNAKIFDYYHRYTRKMPNGLAYHFVIGNGSSSGDGQIEIGNRWTKQMNGGHVHSDFLNSIALGICLVGDFNRDKPTKAQLAALDELIRYLRTRVGKYEGHVAIVKAHKDINPVPTDCPGEHFPYAWLYHTYD